MWMEAQSVPRFRAVRRILGDRRRRARVCSPVYSRARCLPAGQVRGTQATQLRAVDPPHVSGEVCSRKEVMRALA